MTYYWEHELLEDNTGNRDGDAFDVSAFSSFLVYVEHVFGAGSIVTTVQGRQKGSSNWVPLQTFNTDGDNTLAVDNYGWYEVRVVTSSAVNPATSEADISGEV